MTKQAFHEELERLYNEEKMSQAKIATHMGCDITCIENWFSKLSISTRNDSEQARLLRSRTFVIPATQQRVLEGLLLSDTHIEDSIFQARMSFGVKHREFAKKIISSTSSLQWSVPVYNQSCLGWFAKTAYCTNMKAERIRWYPDGIKVIPTDITLTPETVLWWYLGDGYRTKYGAALCTDRFSINDNERLVGLLIDKGIPCHRTPRNRIRIKGNSGFDKLINYIGQPPVECYRYKWGER